MAEPRLAVAADFPFYRFDWQTAIYVLCDPDGTPRYVSQSWHPQGRLKQHLDDARHASRYPPKTLTAKERWLVGLLAEGQMPALKILETVPYRKGHAFEKRWVDWFISEGHDLTNGLYKRCRREGGIK